MDPVHKLAQEHWMFLVPLSEEPWKQQVVVVVGKGCSI